ncbi:MAG: tRNA 2-thiouridine(34) synthase MnmA [Bacteroidales bacterium]|nr:tRNA 2-thiouridine(34) synthase MnmA [Bacteroidales bacterium]
MQIAALVSGGVDSSVMLYLLKEMGYEPTIFYIRIGMKEEEGFMDCASEEDIELTTWLARHFGLKMEVVPLHKEYWDNVMAYTLDAVRKGLTPNPDVMCNRLIKFGEFENYWGKDFDKISTGHYATIVEKEGLSWLGTAKDPIKDQTDFLAQITYNQVKKLMFPVGNLLKQEVRAIAHEVGMPSAHRRDSQGICFLGKVNYVDFLRKYIGEKEGKIIELETGKFLGKHKGFWFHTIGQRKGLGLGQGPWFVVKKDIHENIIYVSNGYDPLSQYGDKIRLVDLNFITSNPWLNQSGPHPVTFKIRHTPEFSKGSLTYHGDHWILQSEKPVAGIAAGQFGVIYDQEHEICLGSGVID